MTATVDRPARPVTMHRSRRTRAIGWAVFVVVVLALMALGTKFVGNDSALGRGPQKFSAAQFGTDNIGEVRDGVTKRAVDATTLSTALKANVAAATKKYATPVAGAPGPEFSVKFTGTVTSVADGIAQVSVPNLRKSLILRVQIGPAINGTDLRDATGAYQFGQFTNQIDYQNAAAALNDAVKKDVLAKLEATKLKGKTFAVVGAFQLINPDGWLVTPVTMDAK